MKNPHMKLARDSAQPLYRQLSEILRLEIRDLPANSKFYSERQLRGMFNVSQPVVRSALAILEKDGHIFRMPPKGTFVRKRCDAAASSQKMKIGVVCSLSASPANPLATPAMAAIKGIYEVGLGHDREVIVFDDENPDFTEINHMAIKVKKYLDSVDGIVWVSGQMTETTELGRAFLDTAKRHAFINFIVSGGGYTCVAADYRSAQYALAKKMISFGYRRIGYIGGPERRLVCRMRYEGFEKAVRESGLEINPVYVQPFREGNGYRTGYKAVKEMIENGSIPDVIMTWNDFIANGAVSALKENKYRVPADVGVTGFDDRDVAVQMEPTLTTVQLPFYELGRIAAKFLLDQINGTSEPGSNCYVPCPIVLRESCGGKLNREEKIPVSSGAF